MREFSFSNFLTTFGSGIFVELDTEVHLFLLLFQVYLLTGVTDVRSVEICGCVNEYPTHELWCLLNIGIEIAQY